ncbi:UDP-N-acetylmuramyl pentapeptide phosphotransferase/UDP-N-acetylglucosamine-1-phosphate transferase [Arcicella aurantiaca]|uniref:UDP-N-acetylmuramyl pentapeptide phosphotransferase/UDP-N-acetylglucosamine-1-phosphate transferase n=1 Tax=Arcicella aurantiaca TaxID=591202 RepID=A0A316DTK3_9BACT|nr:glycosyltransferase family 4 protein [Arcicella aurantiaca]PWK21421.1 UDP-N-acetylmuramyl pentapeptide phosphotransferase/UDP-N-acetylglucosamine-1-phosphate transferase [Arcicella aurantiaca]
MIFIFVTLCLFITELIYFRVAERFNIIDKPNARSLHTDITIRGGGVIFFMSVLFYFIYSNFEYPLFFLGITAIAVISFLDDIFTLPNRYRLPFQFLAIILILVELHFFSNPMWIWTGVLIIGVGIINAYNFMDGINGITGGYSMVVIGALWFINSYHIKFMDNEFFVFILMGLIVFNYFNFRTKAKCFAGDVGSISIAVIIIFLLIKLIVKDYNPIYILFLAVYGVDSVLTIIHRLLLKENIFKAHRLHLFQVIVHTLKIPHLLMASLYMLLQAIICVIIIFNLKSSEQTQWLVSFGIIISLSVLYFIIKRKVMLLTV